MHIRIKDLEQSIDAGSIMVTDASGVPMYVAPDAAEDDILVMEEGVPAFHHVGDFFTNGFTYSSVDKEVKLGGEIFEDTTIYSSSFDFNLDVMDSWLKTTNLMKIESDSAVVIIADASLSFQANDYYFYPFTPSTNNAGFAGKTFFVDSNSKLKYGTITTTNVAEGTNLYYTDARARAALSAGDGIDYDDVTGVISITPTSTNDFIENQTAVSQTASFKISGNGTLNNLTVNGQITSDLLQGLNYNRGLSLEPSNYVFYTNDSANFLWKNVSTTIMALSNGGDLVIGNNGSNPNNKMLYVAGEAEAFILRSPYLYLSADSGLLNGITYTSAGDIVKYMSEGKHIMTIHNGVSFVDALTINPDSDVQLNQYPNSRNDGVTMKALYVDSSGNILHGPIDAYSKTELQTSGSASVHWDNITDVPSTITGIAGHSDVAFTTLADGDLFQYESSSGKWTNQTINNAGGNTGQIAVIDSDLHVKFRTTAEFLSDVGLAGAYFAQGGNSFGALAQFGTLDTYDLDVLVDNTRVMRFFTSGNINVGSGASDPGYLFAVQGDLYTKGITIDIVSKGVGKALVSDANGVGTWTTLDATSIGALTDVTTTDSSEIDFTHTSPTATTRNITGSIIAGSIANSKLTNSTISGISLGSNLATLTISGPLTGTSYNGSTAVSIGIQDADADGATKGAATFAATDFNSASGVISIDYANGQSASGSTKGFLTSGDWTTFNNKISTGAITGSGLTMSTARLLGRTTASTGAVEEISVTSASGITLSSGTLSLSAIPNSSLANSTISGISLGSNLATLTITSPLTGTSYDGSAGVTIALAGLTGLGTANQFVGMNAGATAYEYKTFAVGTSGTDFAIAHTTNTITFNLPSASASNRGVVTTSSQTFAGAKTFSSDLVIGTGTWGRGGGSVSTNISIGVSAGAGTQTNGTSTPNVFIGNSAGTAVTSGYSHIAIGYRALYAQTGGDDNIAIGYRALSSSISTYYNIAIGTDSLFNLVDSGGSFYNVAVGPNSGNNIATGQRNVAMGFYAMGQASSTGNASYNVAIGGTALYGNYSGQYNVAIGYQSLIAATTSNYNVAVGYAALGSVTTTSQNIGLGYNAGNLTTGSYNVFIGSFDGTGFTSSSNQVFIADGQGNVRARAASNGNWIFGGTTDAGYKVDVQGSFRVTTTSLLTGAVTASSTINGMYLSTAGTRNLFISNGAATNLANAQDNTVYGAENAGAALTTSGIRNTLIGTSAGRSITDGYYNVYVGYKAGWNSVSGPTTPGENSVVGYSAGQAGGVGIAALGAYAGFNNTGNAGIFVGYQSGYNSTANHTLAIGYQALYTTTTGLRNLAVGHQAGYTTAGDDNTFIGWQTGKQIAGTGNTYMGSQVAGSAGGGTHTNNTFIGFATGYYSGNSSNNTFMGASAGTNISTGSYNTYLGAGAGYSTSTGQYNVAVGYNCMQGGASITGTDNFAMGAFALKQMTSGIGNIGVGSNAGYSISTNNYNITIGVNAGYSIASSNNIAIGVNSLNATSGSDNIAIGSTSFGFGNSVGSYNVGVGYNAGFKNNGGDYNVLIGWKAGYELTTGDYNVIIGGFDATSYATTSNCVWIADGQGNVRIRIPSTGNVLIGTSTDGGFKLEVNGTSKFSNDITLAADKFLYFGSDYIRTNGARLMTITSFNGIYIPDAVGVGVTPSAYKFEVSGTAKISGVLTLGSITVTTGTGTPEGAVTAVVGSLFIRTDGGTTTTFYVKETGTGNTGWVAK